MVEGKLSAHHFHSPKPGVSERLCIRPSSVQETGTTLGSSSRMGFNTGNWVLPKSLEGVEDLKLRGCPPDVAVSITPLRSNPEVRNRSCQATPHSRNERRDSWKAESSRGSLLVSASTLPFQTFTHTSAWRTCRTSGTLAPNEQM